MADAGEVWFLSVSRSMRVARKSPGVGRMFG